MILSAIAAMAQNRVIGSNNQLPWHLPEDLKFFKEKTKGRILIIGRKTFESLPAPLPGRFHIIVTRQKKYAVKITEKFTPRDFAVVPSVAEAVELAKEISKSNHHLYRESFGDEVFIVGGGEIYKELLPHTDQIYLTVIEKDIEGDAYFPEFDESVFVESERVSKTEPFPFSFRVYKKQL